MLGVKTWIRKHVVKARQMAGEERDKPPEPVRDCRDECPPDRRQPRTLREAIQFLAWFQSVDRMWFLGGALGQLDGPYYERDLEAGLITDEMAIWFIPSLLFNDTHYSQIGGPARMGTT